MLNANWTHGIAVTLVSSGQVLTFMQTNPNIASQMHVTGSVLTVAGFVIALLSQQLFGTPTPPPQPPILTTPPEKKP